MPMRPLRLTVIIAIITAVLLPLLPLFLWSFSHRWYFPALLPTEWSGRAWRYVLEPRSQVATAVLNSTVVALSVTVLSILIGLPAGRALGLHTFHGKGLVNFLILAPTIMPVQAVAMGIHIAFIRYGLADRLLGVILVHLIPVTPYMVLVLASVFANMNPDYEAQAQSLGAKKGQVFWYITLPAIFPGLVVGSLFAFIISWSQYLLTLLIGGGQVITLPVLLFSFANSGDNPLTAALSLVFIAPALLLLWLMARYLSGQSVVFRGVGGKL